MTSLDSTKGSTILLVKEVVHHTNFGVAAMLIGVVHWKRRPRVPNTYIGISAVAANIRVLALRGSGGLMSIIVDIRRSGRSTKSPGRVTWRLVLGLTEEPHRCITVCQFDSTGVEERCHFIVGDLRDGGD